MIESRKRLRLTLKAKTPVGILSESVWQDLDGNVALKFRVAGAKDTPHSALSDESTHLVTTDSAAHFYRHKSNSARPLIRTRELYPSTLVTVKVIQTAGAFRYRLWLMRRAARLIAILERSPIFFAGQVVF